MKRLRFLVVIVVIIILMITTSCRTVSPVGQQPEDFLTIEAVKPVWQDFADGVGYFHAKINSPKLEFFALQIDLNAPSIEIFVKNNLYSSRVSSFVRDNGLIAGINATPFNIVSTREGQPLENTGIVISNGQLIAPVITRYDALIFYKDGTAAIINQSLIDSIENIQNAIGGFHQVLLEANPAPRTLNSEVRHPRSAAGISANGQYLYLLVIDGRRKGSIGATEQDTALLLRSFGSWNGINLDGGGSSALVLRFPNGKVRAVNTPIHGGIRRLERAVAGSLGIISKLPPP